MEPNLSASITMHPHPWRLESSPPSRSSSRAPIELTATPERSVSRFVDARALSTGVEVGRDDDEVGAAVERHPSAAQHSTGGVTDVEDGQDVEGQTTGRLARPLAEHDPYGLSSAYKTEQDLARIRSMASSARKRSVATPAEGEDSHTTGRRIPASASSSDTTGPTTGPRVPASTSQGLLARCVPASLRALIPSPARRAVQTRRLQGFYKEQNAEIENMLKSVEEHQAEARQEQGDDQLKYRIAVYGSFAANVVLAALQVYGAIASGSLSLFTTMADAVFDPLSNVTLILTNRAVKRVDAARFPSGKARLETVGNIVFCFLMTAVSFVLVAFSARQLAQGHKEGKSATNRFHLPSVIAVAIAFATKLALFLYTWALKDRYSQVHILWQDHRNDLMINGFGLLTSVGGSKLVWWIDPAGAIALGVLVSAIWLRTAFAEFLLLVGVTASAETQRLITYVCVTHSPAVRQIDTVRVYHSGPRLIAEVDIVMPREATLAETHDVAEALQFKLECLPDIERAYVHVDYETTHKPEHALKKEL